MTREEFIDLVQRLKDGDNEALVCLQCFREPCIQMLLVRSKRRCDADTAYDIFIDSVMDFRQNVLRDHVRYGNIGAYLIRICWNKWLARSRTKARQAALEPQVRALVYDTSPVEDFPGQREHQYSVDMELLEKAMGQISASCRQILSLAIADELPMIEIARRLGLANADVAKTTKSRCYKKLLTIIQNLREP